MAPVLQCSGCSTRKLPQAALEVAGPTWTFFCSQAVLPLSAGEGPNTMLSHPPKTATITPHQLLRASTSIEPQPHLPPLESTSRQHRRRHVNESLFQIFIRLRQQIHNGFRRSVKSPRRVRHHHALRQRTVLPRGGALHLARIIGLSRHSLQTTHRLVINTRRCYQPAATVYQWHDAGFWRAICS